MYCLIKLVSSCNQFNFLLRKKRLTIASCMTSLSCEPLDQTVVGHLGWLTLIFGMNHLVRQRKCGMGIDVRSADLVRRLLNECTKRISFARIFSDPGTVHNFHDGAHAAKAHKKWAGGPNSFRRLWVYVFSRPLSLHYTVDYIPVPNCRQ